MEKTEHPLQGIQSVEIAGELLAVLARSKHSMPLGKLAADAGMPASKARRYLVSLCRIGLVQQETGGGHYAPGPLAFALGSASMARRSVLPAALPAMRALRDEFNETVSLVVWGPLGPTVLHYEESERAVRLNTSVGSVMPLLTSASGQIFGAYLPRQKTARLLKAELTAVAAGGANVAPQDEAAVEALFEQVRANGMSCADGTLLSSVGALGAPILDRHEQLVGGLVIVGHHGNIDLSIDGPLAQGLAQAAKTVGETL